MTSIRVLVLALGTVAMLGAPMLQTDALAQGRRHARRAAVPRRGGVVVAAYYRPLRVSPFYYDPFYDPWWYPYPYGWYRPYPYGRGYDESASLRLQVTPRETQVFVDGYYAGIVNEFDGMFQRLHVEPGQHEIALYLQGHRTTSQRVFLQHGTTFRIRHAMEPLGPGEKGDDRPAPGASSAPSPRRGGAQTRRDVPREDDVIRGDANFGAIAIRVQPADAEIFIDGEQWEGPLDDEALVVQVAPGEHRIEARKEGYRTYSAEVTVTAARTSPINVSLSRR